MINISSRKDVPRDNLVKLLQDLWKGYSGYAIGFLFDKAEIVEYAPDKLQSWQDGCYEGYLFDDSMEVHWRLRTDDRFVLVVANDSDIPIPDGFGTFAGSQDWTRKDTDESIFLWGKCPPFPGYSGQVSKWFEQRIPMLFEYPHPPQKRVKAIVRSYADTNGGICYRRFVGLG